MILTDKQRNKIRTALASYEDAVNQKEQVLADTEIQGYFSKAFDLTNGHEIENAEADVFDKMGSDLITKKYPLARDVNKNLIKLIKAMTENIDAYKHIEITQVLYNLALADKFITLAKRV